MQAGDLKTMKINSQWPNSISICFFNWFLVHRCDQYKWVLKGTRTAEFGKHSIKKKTGAIDVKDKKPEADNNSFKRLEF